MASAEYKEHISIQCVDDADAYRGEVVWGDESFPNSTQQDATGPTASDDGQGHYSSVQPFQFAHYENEDTDYPSLDIDAPETDGNSLAGLQEEEKEEDEEDDWSQDVNINVTEDSNLFLQ